MYTGFFFALTGDGFTYEEIEDTADMLKRELLLVEGVANVEIWGDQQEVVKIPCVPFTHDGTRCRDAGNTRYPEPSEPHSGFRTPYGG